MASFLPDGSGAIVNASRSVLYAFDREPYRDRFEDWRDAVAAAARDFRDDLASAINRHAGG
jgi:orotidine-5'-phosphate decarboxylase